MIGAIGAGMGRRAAIAEFRAGRVAERPAAHRLPQLDDGDPDRHRKHHALDRPAARPRRAPAAGWRARSRRGPSGRRTPAPRAAARRTRRAARPAAAARWRRRALGDLARPARPSRCTLPITALRVSPWPRRLAIWLALLPSIQACRSCSTRSSVQDIVASFVTVLVKSAIASQNPAPAPGDDTPPGETRTHHAF